LDTIYQEGSTSWHVDDVVVDGFFRFIFQKVFKICNLIQKILQLAMQCRPAQWQKVDSCRGSPRDNTVFRNFVFT
jgi:hypothetical protein